MAVNKNFGNTNVGNLQTNSPRLFNPTIARSIKNGYNGIVNGQKVDGNSLEKYTFNNTSSFSSDPVGYGLKSTQQLNIDWSVFSNHTFFNSAQVKTNVAFDTILNQYPFDQNETTIKQFLDNLTGFEKYVYDNFPKYKGYLFLSGTKTTEGSGGTYVVTKDIAGAAYPGASTNLTGETILNPGYDSLTIEMQVYLPAISNSNQMLIDKHTDYSPTNAQGYLIGLQNTGSLTHGKLSMYIASGTLINSYDMVLEKGAWNHVAYVWDRTPGVDSIIGYVNGQLYGSSSVPQEFGYITNYSNDLLIGSGSSLLTSSFAPRTTFSGAIDELRIWGSARSQKQIDEYKQKSIFATDDLKLYYKFNEPSGILSDIVVDYSMKSLHGRLSATGYSMGVRNIATASIAGTSPMTYEKLEYSPILFPEYSGTLNLQTTLLASASIHDASNPNLITKLIPRHYLDAGAQKDALDPNSDDIGSIVDAFQSGNDPRSSKLGGTQAMLLLMYTWAKYFDELKLYVQAFSNLNWVDYNTEDNIPDNFLQFMANQSGVDLPPLFQDASLEQYFDAENIDNFISTNNRNLNGIQNEIWRRILINLQDILRSKGTIYSIKAFMRAVGVDPDNNFRIREYGGPNKSTLSWVRDNRSEEVQFLNFVSGGYVKSNYLKAAKVEPGWPYSDATSLTTGNNILLTSGSWTYEGLYKFDPNTTQLSQSLMRTAVSGVAVSGSNPAEFLYGNVLYHDEDNSVEFVYRVIGDVDTMKVRITGSNLYDGDAWYVSVGKIRNDEAQLNSAASSSYFLRVAKNINGEIYESFTTSSWFPGSSDSYNFNAIFYDMAGTGSQFISIGSSSYTTGPGNYGLNDSALPNDYRYTKFNGQVSQVRFWSKYLEDKEWMEHVRNYKSVGVQDPKTNWNFDTISTGSWNRLRMSIEMDQVTMETDAAGNIQFVDFSQNDIWLTGSSFNATSSVLTPNQIYFSYLSPHYDEGSTIQKVRVRSYQDTSNFLNNENVWAAQAPVYELTPSETPQDSTKFTIDFSIVDFLNQDIMTIFATLEELDNAIGNPELMYSEDYPSLEVLRKNYFNKLTDKVNLKGFFEFYKWFDTNIGTFIEQLVPMKTKFLGTNYIIESSAIERAKVQYHAEDIYVGASNRNGLKSTILLEIISGFFSRY